MKIFRKRYIPEEVVDISGDEVVFINDEMIVTKWLPIHPRSDVARGVSYTMLKKGWKISKFYDKNDNMLFWYCDIIKADFDGNELLITDLLVDVKVFNDGSYEILDIEELEEALEKGLITSEIKEEALLKLNELETLIKDSGFPPFKEII